MKKFLSFKDITDNEKWVSGFPPIEGSDKSSKQHNIIKHSELMHTLTKETLDTWVMTGIKDEVEAYEEDVPLLISDMKRFFQQKNYQKVVDIVYEIFPLFRKGKLSADQQNTLILLWARALYYMWDIEEWLALLDQLSISSISYEHQMNFLYTKWIFLFQLAIYDLSRMSEVAMIFKTIIRNHTSEMSPAMYKNAHFYAWLSLWWIDHTHQAVLFLEKALELQTDDDSISNELISLFLWFFSHEAWDKVKAQKYYIQYLRKHPEDKIVENEFMSL